MESWYQFLVRGDNVTLVATFPDFPSPHKTNQEEWRSSKKTPALRVTGIEELGCRQQNTVHLACSLCLSMECCPWTTFLASSGCENIMLLVQDSVYLVPGWKLLKNIKWAEDLWLMVPSAAFKAFGHSVILFSNQEKGCIQLCGVNNQLRP